ncbi:hypothetical protein A5697_06940 [Mycobacterium sp. E3251]|uniref:hypothetical protein n=1 Tax=Mycobacterium sp. E3251 TaxID=1834144 RepID=UPI0007FD3553|nr:hypothetical protein [Mycobacterium sp. E3251]OBG92640.1 hypothetical protein A5697_06940 [Mycobacterium sp. E3251]
MTSENASDWRDLAAELPADRAATLARREAKLLQGGMPADQVAALMLDFARAALHDRTFGVLYPDVPVPAGAEAFEWEPHADGSWRRGLHWGSWGAGEPITVDVRRPPAQRRQRQPPDRH